MIALASGAVGAAGSASAAQEGAYVTRPPRRLDFTPAPPNTTDAVTVPEGYSRQVVIRWGDPVLPGAPRFNTRNQSAKPRPDSSDATTTTWRCWTCPHHGQKLLVVNHEYTSEQVMFYGHDPDNPTREQAEIAWAAHGLTVLVVREDRRAGRLWPVVGDVLNRRITATTPFLLTDPAAGSDLLKTSADLTGRKVLGTLNNCGGLTPPPRPASPATACPPVRASASGSASTTGSTSPRSPTSPTGTAGSSRPTRTTPRPPRAIAPSPASRPRRAVHG